MNLIAKINDEIKLLNEEQFPQENEYEFYESMSEVLNEEKDLYGFTTTDIMLTLFIINSKEKTFAETLKTFKPIYDYCNKISKVEKFLLFLDIVENLSYYIEMEEMLKFTENFNTREMVCDILIDDPDEMVEPDMKLSLTALLIEYRKIGLEIFEDKEKIKAFIELYYKYDGILNDDYSSIIRYKENYESVQYMKSSHFRRHVKPYHNYVKTSSGQKLSVSEAQKQFGVPAVLTKLSERHFEVSKKRDSYLTNKNKKIKVYRQTIEILEKMQQRPDKVVVIEDSLYNKLDDEICVELLRLALEHNRKVFNELELKNIKNNKYNKIEKLFIQYSFPINELEETERNILLKNSSPDKIEILLQFLSKDKWLWLNVKNSDFTNVLLNSSIEILEFVNHYLENEVISKELIQQNIGILIDAVKVNIKDTEPMFNRFKANVDYLNRVIFSLDRRLIKNQELLIMPTEVLKKTVTLVKKYHLNFKSENAKQYSLEILNHTEIFDCLDEIIELGYANYIKENPQILKANANETVARLSIMTNIGLDPMSKEDRLLGSITNGKNFYVGTSSLKQYSLLKVEEHIKNPYFEILKNNPRIVISKATENLDIVKKLDEMYKTSELEYVIDDSVISRIKFLRNLECLLIDNEINDELIFAALTFNSTLEGSTISSIKNMLKGTFDKKQKVITQL